MKLVPPRKKSDVVATADVIRDAIRSGYVSGEPSRLTAALEEAGWGAMSDPSQEILGVPAPEGMRVRAYSGDYVQFTDGQLSATVATDGRWWVSGGGRYATGTEPTAGDAMAKVASVVSGGIDTDSRDGIAAAVGEDRNARGDLKIVASSDLGEPGMSRLTIAFNKALGAPTSDDVARVVAESLGDCRILDGWVEGSRMLVDVGPRQANTELPSLEPLPTEEPEEEWIPIPADAGHTPSSRTAASDEPYPYDNYRRAVESVFQVGLWEDPEWLLRTIRQRPTSGHFPAHGLDAVVSALEHAVANPHDARAKHSAVARGQRLLKGDYDILEGLDGTPPPEQQPQEPQQDTPLTQNLGDKMRQPAGPDQYTTDMVNYALDLKNRGYEDKHIERAVGAAMSAGLIDEARQAEIFKAVSEAGIDIAPALLPSGPAESSAPEAPDADAARRELTRARPVPENIPQRIKSHLIGYLTEAERVLNTRSEEGAIEFIRLKRNPEISGIHAEVFPPIEGELDGGTARAVLLGDVATLRPLRDGTTQAPQPSKRREVRVSPDLTTATDGEVTIDIPPSLRRDLEADRFSPVARDMLQRLIDRRRDPTGTAQAAMHPREREAIIERLTRLLPRPYMEGAIPEEIRRKFDRSLGNEEQSDAAIEQYEATRDEAKSLRRAGDYESAEEVEREADRQLAQAIRKYADSPGAVQDKVLSEYNKFIAKHGRMLDDYITYVKGAETIEFQKDLLRAYQSGTGRTPEERHAAGLLRLRDRQRFLNSLSAEAANRLATFDTSRSGSVNIVRLGGRGAFIDSDAKARELARLSGADRFESSQDVLDYLDQLDQIGESAEQFQKLLQSGSPSERALYHKFVRMRQQELQTGNPFPKGMQLNLEQLNDAELAELAETVSRRFVDVREDEYVNTGTDDQPFYQRPLGRLQEGEEEDIAAVASQHEASRDGRMFHRDNALFVDRVGRLARDAASSETPPGEREKSLRILQEIAESYPADVIANPMLLAGHPAMMQAAIDKYVSGSPERWGYVAKHMPARASRELELLERSIEANSLRVAQIQNKIAEAQSLAARGGVSAEERMKHIRSIRSLSDERAALVEKIEQDTTTASAIRRNIARPDLPSEKPLARERRRTTPDGDAAARLGVADMIDRGTEAILAQIADDPQQIEAIRTGGDSPAVDKVANALAVAVRTAYRRANQLRRQGRGAEIDDDDLDLLESLAGVLVKPKSDDAVVTPAQAAARASTRAELGYRMRITPSGEEEQVPIPPEVLAAADQVTSRLEELAEMHERSRSELGLSEEDAATLRARLQELQEGGGIPGFTELAGISEAQLINNVLNSSWEVNEDEAKRQARDFIISKLTGVQGGEVSDAIPDIDAMMNAAVARATREDYVGLQMDESTDIVRDMAPQIEELIAKYYRRYEELKAAKNPTEAMKAELSLLDHVMAAASSSGDPKVLETEILQPYREAVEVRDGIQATVDETRARLEELTRASEDARVELASALEDEDPTLARQLMQGGILYQDVIDKLKHRYSLAEDGSEEKRLIQRAIDAVRDEYTTHRKLSKDLEDLARASEDIAVFSTVAPAAISGALTSSQVEELRARISEIDAEEEALPPHRTLDEALARERSLIQTVLDNAVYPREGQAEAVARRMLRGRLGLTDAARETLDSSQDIAFDAARKILTERGHDISYNPISWTLDRAGTGVSKTDRGLRRELDEEAERKGIEDRGEEVFTRSTAPLGRDMDSLVSDGAIAARDIIDAGLAPAKSGVERLEVLVEASRALPGGLSELFPALYQISRVPNPRELLDEATTDAYSLVTSVDRALAVSGPRNEYYDQEPQDLAWARQFLRQREQDKERSRKPRVEPKSREERIRDLATEARELRRTILRGDAARLHENKQLQDLWLKVDSLGLKPRGQRDLESQGLEAFMTPAQYRRFRRYDPSIAGQRSRDEAEAMRYVRDNIGILNRIFDRKDGQVRLRGRHEVDRSFHKEYDQLASDPDRLRLVREAYRRYQDGLTERPSDTHWDQLSEADLLQITEKIIDTLAPIGKKRDTQSRQRSRVPTREEIVRSIMGPTKRRADARELDKVASIVHARASARGVTLTAAQRAAIIDCLMQPAETGFLAKQKKVASVDTYQMSAGLLEASLDMEGLEAACDRAVADYMVRRAAAGEEMPRDRVAALAGALDATPRLAGMLSVYHRVAASEAGDDGTTPIGHPEISIDDTWYQGDNFLYIEMSWDPEQMGNRSDDGVRHVVLSEVKAMEADKVTHGIGYMGRPEFKEFDPDKGIAVVSVKVSNPGRAPERVVTD